MTHSDEVRRMKSKEQSSCEINNWIAQNEIPVSPGLKVIRRSNPNYGLTEDEIKDRNEFIRCYLMQEQEALMVVPSQNSDDDFFIADCDVTDSEYSAVNTVDFQRTMRPFDKYGYAMKKIMERVKDLAIRYSVISSQERRVKTHRRYESLVEFEFRSRLLAFVEQYRNSVDEQRRFILKQRIGELNRRILDCKKMWEQYAPRDY